MNRSRITFAAILAAGLAAFPQANGTDQILAVARNTWPGSQTVGIVCNYAKSGESIRAMLDSFAPGSAIKVMDVRHTDHIATACVILGRINPKYVLLLPNDPLVHDGSFEASFVIARMNYQKIPTLATTPNALSQGAWAVMGPATGNVLQVNPSLQEFIDAHGAPMSPSSPIAKYSGGGQRAALSVIAAF